MPYRDDDHEVLDPREFPEPEPNDSRAALLPCPHCLAVISETSARCPRCGNWLPAEDAPSRKPWWVIAGALVCLGMAIYWIFA